MKFGVDDVAEAMRLGQEAAAASLQKGCSAKTFIKPIKWFGPSAGGYFIEDNSH